MMPTFRYWRYSSIIDRIVTPHFRWERQAISEYVWQHTLGGETERLYLMSNILDPSSCYHLSGLPISKDWRCIELGAGNGSLSNWLATRIGPDGKVIATDIAPGLIKNVKADDLEVRGLDIVKDGLDENTYDLISIRALLHHLPTRMDVIAKMVKALKPGGWIFIQEPDISPTLVVEPADQSEFWSKFLKWAAEKQIDYFIGRKIAQRLQELGIANITSEGHAIQYPGGSEFARWWQLGIAEASDRMIADNAATEESLDRFFAHCQDPTYWTQTIAFTAVTGQKPL